MAFSRICFVSFVLLSVFGQTLLGFPIDDTSTASSNIVEDLQKSVNDVNDLSDPTLIHSQADEDNSEKGFRISLLPSPIKTRESVNLEVEGIPSKILTSYDNTHQKVSDLTNPIPIVDTIHEHEKYGNNGDMFDGISRSLVNGYEAFSNFLNLLIQKPKEFARSISRGITAQLDIIGGKIVGL